MHAQTHVLGDPARRGIARRNFWEGIWFGGVCIELNLIFLQFRILKQ